jgi:hypothetical protein
MNLTLSIPLIERVEELAEHAGLTGEEMMAAMITLGLKDEVRPPFIAPMGKR